MSQPFTPQSTLDHPPTQSTIKWRVPWRWFAREMWRAQFQNEPAFKIIILTLIPSTIFLLAWLGWRHLLYTRFPEKADMADNMLDLVVMFPLILWLPFVAPPPVVRISPRGIRVTFLAIPIFRSSWSRISAITIEEAQPPTITFTRPIPSLNHHSTLTYAIPPIINLPQLRHLIESHHPTRPLPT